MTVSQSKLTEESPSTRSAVVRSADGVEWEPKPSNCPVCGANDFRLVGKRGGEYHRDQKGVAADIVKCRKCTVFYSNPTLYPLTNPYEVTGENYFVGGAHDPNRKIKEGAEFVGAIEKILGRKGVVLEAACGKGEFLVGAIRRGWQARGVEMTEYFAEIATDYGIDVEVASVEESSYLEQPSSCDAIFMLAMLEHLYDPISMIRKAHKVLVPGGIAVINVPNEVTSLVNRIGNQYVKLMYGKSWTMSLSPTFSPFHVVGFSPKSLAYALESNGFEILSLTTASGTNELPPAKDFRQLVERFALSISLMVGKVADRLNKGNEIMCWARKKS
jgi:SAM-dependent methyltransferase